MSEWPHPRRPRGGREHAATAGFVAHRPCRRPSPPGPTPTDHDEWLRLDDRGRVLPPPGAGPPAPLDRHARALLTSLGELLGRPIELLSVCANPLGARLLVSVATRETARSGPVLRTAVAAGTAVPAVLTEAVVAAHLGTDSVLRAAADRLAEDGVITSGLLVEDGVERWYGTPDRSGPLPRLVAGPRPVVTPASSTRVARAGSTILAVTLPDDTAARRFDLWSDAVARRLPAPVPGVGTRP